VLAQTIPASVDIEAMSDSRTPVAVERPRSAAATSFRALLRELDRTMR
jgi:hypothetical protein